MQSQVQTKNAHPLWKNLSDQIPLLSPKYPPQYRDIFFTLKNFIQRQQFTQEANKIAQKLIPFLETNYNCWYVKKKCIINGTTSLQHQNDYSKIILMQKIKNFQIWEYRRFLTERSNKYNEQYYLIDKVLQIEWRNYHAWTYRAWILKHVRNFQEEIKAVDNFIVKDQNNNSAWAYRFYLFGLLVQNNPKLKHEIIIKQISERVKQAKKSLTNQSLWNYIRGFYPPIKLKSFPYHKTLLDYTQAQELFQACKQITTDQKKKTNALQAFITLVHIYSHQPNTHQYAKNICQILIEINEQKLKYWSWIKISI